MADQQGSVTSPAAGERGSDAGAGADDQVRDFSTPVLIAGCTHCGRVHVGAYQQLPRDCRKCGGTVDRAGAVLLDEWRAEVSLTLTAIADYVRGVR